MNHQAPLQVIGRNAFGRRRIMSGLMRLTQTNTHTMTTKKSRILIGSEIKHGSPGYENRETIARIYGDATNGELVTIEFESGIFTRMSIDDYAEFIKTGKVVYARELPDGNASETIKLFKL